MKRLLPLVLFLALAAPARGDAAPPTASALAGTLIAPGPRHGVVWLTFNAAADAGLRRATLSVDGSARNVPLDDDAVWSALAVELTWDTAAVHDGTHVVSAQVEDLAGNVGFAFGPAVVTTDNEPPVAGTVVVTRSAQTLTASPNGFDGQDVEYAYRWQRCDPGCEDIGGATHARYALTAADAGQAVRAVVTAIDLGGATTARSPQVAIGIVTAPGDGLVTPAPTTRDGCAARAPGAPTHGFAAPAAVRGLAVSADTCVPPNPPAPVTPVATPGPLPAPFTAPPGPRVVLGWRTIRVAYGDRVELTGHVVDSDGNPFAGATLDVRSRLRVPRAMGRRVGVIVSGRDGSFTHAFKADASRDLTIGGRTVTLLVRAAGTFSATRAGRVVTLRGRLRGGHIPAGGVLIALSAGHRIVRLTRTDARGAFTARVAARTLSFHAVARKDSSWPFVPVRLSA